ncbi:MAG: VOC family protein [Actinomycetota bacterium]|nr:VOC family protein [Actinomycetota bacterium]
MPETNATTVPAAGRLTLTPYLAVDDARRALDWYADVFDGRPEGQPTVMPDGRIGHAELIIGNAPLMLADEHPELGLLGPKARGGTSQSIVMEVPDVEATVRRAVAAGAELTRPVADQPYGRNAVITDPFGHRWLVTTSAPRAAEPSGSGHGDVGYVSMLVTDAQRARDFYAGVLGWDFSPGSVEHGWQVEGCSPMVGLAGGADRPQVQLCFRVHDLDGALVRVRHHGGQAAEPVTRPYGRLADCVDNQGVHFQLWQP